jgi:hypothetical protein
MLPVSYGRRHQLGMLFHCVSSLSELSWDPQEVAINHYIPPARDKIVAFIEGLNQSHNVVQHSDMGLLFPSWPNGVVEEWAVDYNDEFLFKFDAFYEASSMETKIYIKAFGESNVSWYEYADSYRQALTMMKLKEGL